jgi:hypothetical protein
MTFDNLNSYTITGPGSITLDDSYRSTINVFSGSHTLALPVVLPRDCDADVLHEAELVFEGSLVWPAGASFHLMGGGTLRAAAANGGRLTVGDGKLVITPNGTAAGASRIGSLNLGGGTIPGASPYVGTLDLNDNDLIVTHSSVAGLSAAIANARHGGAWDRAGITSSSARTQVNHATTLGVLSGAEYSAVTGSTTFNGFSIADTDVLVKYTWYGDTDFNGRVNFDDYVRTDNGFNNHLSGWLNGDFDLNGQVNFDDYVLIDLAFNTQSGTLGRALAFLDGSDRSASGMSDPALRRVEQHFAEFGSAHASHLLAAVPEPMAVALASMAIALLPRRRRRP